MKSRTAISSSSSVLLILISFCLNLMLSQKPLLVSAQMRGDTIRNPDVNPTTPQDNCKLESNRFALCVGGKGSIDLIVCGSCYSTALQKSYDYINSTVVKTCNELGFLMCNTITTCADACGGDDCMDEFEALIECAVFKETGNTANSTTSATNAPQQQEYDQQLTLAAITTANEAANAAAFQVPITTLARGQCGEDVTNYSICGDILTGVVLEQKEIPSSAGISWVGRASVLVPSILFLLTNLL